MKYEQFKSKLLDIDLIVDKLSIKERMKIADLGCGASGGFLFKCAKLTGENGRIYAVDILKEVLDVIERKIKQENIQNITSIWSNLETFGATEIESSSLDIAMLINTLFQSSKRVELIREAVRMLKTDGKLLIVEWKNSLLPFAPKQENRVNIDALINQASKLNLKVFDEFEAGQYHSGVIFNKV